ncbi:MAG: transposase [Candidatus Sedimenticola sp. (ex Thyasira tokunagai)]
METWLSNTREANPDYDPIPQHVERDLRKFLECGILAYGCARARCDECGEDFLIAYSCKGRGICPSCNTKHMAETAAHLVDHLFPQVPVRQWVITLPKRLRYYLLQDAELTGRALQIGLRVIERTLREQCPDAPPTAKYGGVTYIHRFGSSLNAHLHFHSCMMDGLFAQTEEGLQFYEATGLSDEVIQQAQKKIRKRVLRLFVRRGLLTSDDAEQMQTWQNGGGFSLNAEVRIDGADRQGLERLFRYCARPIFAGERLCWQEQDEMLIYHLRKPQHDGQTLLRLTPAEFLDRIATLIPPPRRHRHRYHGVLAPNAPLREQVTNRAGQPVTDESVVSGDKPKAGVDEEQAAGCLFASIWAMLLARIYEINPLVCPRCGGEMRIIAFITELEPIRRILRHIGEPDSAPEISPARGPPDFFLELDQSQAWSDEVVDPVPEFEYDQTVNW